jgi:hypothetical protein
MESGSQRASSTNKRGEKQLIIARSVVDIVVADVGRHVRGYGQVGGHGWRVGIVDRVLELFAQPDDVLDVLLANEDRVRGLVDGVKLGEGQGGLHGVADLAAVPL